MNKLSTSLSLGACLLLVGCDGEPSSVPPSIQTVACARLLTNGMYEIQLRYSVTSSGGPCLNKDFFKTWTSHETNWVFVRSLEGSQTADQIVVRDGVKDNVGDYTYPIEGLEGKVSFDKDALTVDLRQPHILPSGATQGFVPYRLNGTYQIVQNK